MNTFGRMRDISLEYEQFAEYFAKRYGNGLTRQDGTFWGSALVNVPIEIIDIIEANPTEWEERVKDYAYGFSMSNLGDTE